VDDNQDAREVVAELLETAGFRVAQAMNGLEGVERACALQPDLVLMDMAMPLLDGFEATRRIRAVGRTSEAMPIVGVTAYAAPHILTQALHAGCTAVVTKPLSLDELLRTIRDALARAAR
jgi:two-component system, cell cycle response regulator DivK